MSAQPVHTGSLPPPLPKQSRQIPEEQPRRGVSEHAVFAGWLAAFCLLAVGPGAMPYAICTAAAEVIVAALFLWRIVSAPRWRMSPALWLAAGWLTSEVLSTGWGYATGWGTRSPYPSVLYAGGASGPAHLLIDAAIGIAALFASAEKVDKTASDQAGLRRAGPVLLAAAGVLVLCAIEAARNHLVGTDDPRLQASFTNPNLLGAFLCLTLPLAFGALLTRGIDRRARIGLGMLCAGLAVSLLLTQSRGAILGCGIGLSYLGACAWTMRGLDRRERARRGRAAISVLSLGCIVIVVCVLALVPRLSRLSHSASDDQRRVAWQGAAAIIRQHPLTGLGVDSYPAALAAQHLMQTNPDTPTGLPKIPAIHLHAHDLLLEAWVERGLPGALLVLALAWLTLRSAASTLLSRRGGPLNLIQAGATACLIASLAQNVSDYTLWYVPVGVLFWYVLGLSEASLGLLSPSAGGTRGN